MSKEIQKDGFTVWETLSKTDVTKQVELKKNFSYLSWAWAWAYLKNIYPDATFEKHTFRDNQDKSTYHIHHISIVC